MERPDPIDLAVGARIRIRRKAIRVSQSDLAEHLGVSFQQVQKYERGANRISASMLVRAADRLGMTVADLVGEAPGSVTGDDTLQLLASPGALELLQAFSTVTNPGVRASILALVRSTSEQS
jgi:transcriptional regulator with XRE-family HTH domain